MRAAFIGSNLSVGFANLLCLDLAEPGADLAFPALRRIAGARTELARNRNLEDLHLVGGAGLVMTQVARDEERIALLDPERAAILELQLDPALEDVDELSVALVI